jgi:creatinine amidohydrolase
METNVDGSKVLYADFTWKELDALDRAATVVVLPSGSLEQHGPHLTMASDSTAAEAVALAAAKRVPGSIVMPCLWYTPCLDTSNYTGTISISSVNFVNHLCDIMLSLYRHGFGKLVIANVHGGAKTALDVAVREFHARMGTADKAYADDFFIHLHNIYVPAIELLNEMAEGKDWGHACEMETSLDLYLDAERVKPDAAPEEYIPWGKGFEWYIGDMRAVNESGVHGDATKASAEKGEKVFKALVEGLVGILEGAKSM